MKKTKTFLILVSLALAVSCGIKDGPSLLSGNTARGPLVSFAWIGALDISNVVPGWSQQNVASYRQLPAGQLDGGFGNINGIAIDEKGGLLYTVDSNLNRVNKTDLRTGLFIGSIGFTSASVGNCPSNGMTPGWCTGGSFALGTGDGAFKSVNDIGIDVPRDTLYLTDKNNYRVSKYVLSTGVYVGSIGYTTSSTGTCPVGIASTWCTGGVFASSAVDGGFYRPIAMAIDAPSDLLYVSQSNNHRIDKFNASTGTYLGSVGYLASSVGTCPASGPSTSWCTGGTFTSTGPQQGSYGSIIGLSIDIKNKFLFVADQTFNSITRLNLDTGSFAGAIGYLTGSTGSCPSSGAAPGWCSGGTFAAAPILGTGDGEFKTPYGLSVDPDYNLMYVGDADGNRIEQFNLTTGAFIGAKGLLTSSTGTCPASGPANTWCTGGTFTSSALIGGFNYPQNALATSDGYIYMLDNRNARIVRISYR